VYIAAKPGKNNAGLRVSSINEVLNVCANYTLPFRGLGMPGMDAYSDKHGVDFFRYRRTSVQLSEVV